MRRARGRSGAAGAPVTRALRFLSASIGEPLPVAFLLIAALPAIAQPAGGPRIAVAVSPVANLVYQLDCLSGLMRCTRAAYRELWSEMPAGEDEALLAEWRKLRHAPLPRPDLATLPDGPYPPSFAPPDPQAAALRARLLGAGLEAADAAAYAANLEGLAPRATAERLGAILTHFEPRFLQWWRRGAGDDLQRVALGHELVGARIGLRGFLGRVGRLYGVPPDRRPRLGVYLIALPGEPKASQATVVGSYALVETPRGEAPEDRMGVIVHELAHHLHAAAPAAGRRALQEAFLAQDAPWSLAVYNLLGEALATAIGNGILESRMRSTADFERYRSLPDSFYADYYVDTVAKAISPLVERYLDTGRALDAGFAGDYVALAGEALGERRDDLALQLSTAAVVIYDSALAPLEDYLLEHYRVYSLYTHTLGHTGERSALERWSELSGIAIVTPETLPDAAGLIGAQDRQAIAAMAEREPAFVYALPRSARATLYVVVGATPNEARRAYDALLASAARFTGLRLPPER